MAGGLGTGMALPALGRCSGDGGHGLDAGSEFGPFAAVRCRGKGLKPWLTAGPAPSSPSLIKEDPPGLP